MPISIRFALRSPKKGQLYTNPHPLQVWITVNRSRIHFGAVWPLKTGQKLGVDPTDWQVKPQRSSRRDDPINKHLPKLKAHILDVFDKQHLVAPATAESVYYELQEGQTPAYSSESGWQTGRPKPNMSTLTADTSLMEVCLSRVIALERQYGPSPLKKQKIEIGRWRRGLDLLRTWAKWHDCPVPPVAKITLSWLKDYHRWLQTQHSRKQANPVSAPMASRYIGQIGKVLDYLVEAELLERNNVKKQAWPRYEDKEVFFLEPEHVAKLFTLKWKRTKGLVLWWFLLMCCTGLDYPDAESYARNRRLFERVGASGRKLVGRRNKSGEEFDVPLLDEVEWLFAVYPSGPQELGDGTLNRYTDQIEGILGVDKRITGKTARKTFACLMLINGYYIGEVSRMLGHTNIKTTQSHYIKVIGTMVDRGRERVGHSSLLANIINRATEGREN